MGIFFPTKDQEKKWEKREKGPQRPKLAQKKNYSTGILDSVVLPLSSASSPMQAKQKDVKNGCRADQAVAPKDSKVQTIIDLLKGHSNASINLEAAFAGKSGGIPVHQHKFRQTLFGSAGKPNYFSKIENNITHKSNIT